MFVWICMIWCSFNLPRWDEAFKPSRNVWHLPDCQRHPPSSWWCSPPRYVRHLPDCEGPAVPGQGLPGQPGSLAGGERLERIFLFQVFFFSHCSVIEDKRLGDIFLLQRLWNTRRRIVGGHQEQGGLGFQKNKNVNSSKKVESKAQSIVANIRIYEGILMNVPAVIYCFLAGVIIITRWQ